MRAYTVEGNKMTDFRAWIPIRVYPEAGDFWVDWLRLGNKRLDAPFFQDSIQELLRHPFHHAFRQQTPIDVMNTWSQRSPGLEPSGFVFHASRCGSTLIAQMLAVLSKNCVYSEAPALDTLLRSLQRFPQWPDHLRIESLRALLSAWGQEVVGEDTAPRQHLIIKHDGWSVLNAPLVRAAWPATPWVFVYRNPLEILVSQVRQRASFLIPGIADWETAGLLRQEDANQEPVEYCARRLGSIFEAMLKHFDPETTLLINYTELPVAVTARIAPHFKLALDADELQLMEAASARDAKSPSQSFTPDSANKKLEASDHMRAMAERWMLPHYLQLEACREKQNGKLISQALQPSRL